MVIKLRCQKVIKKLIPPGGGIMHSQLVLVISVGLDRNNMQIGFNSGARM